MRVVNCLVYLGKEIINEWEDLLRVWWWESRVRVLGSGGGLIK